MTTPTRPGPDAHLSTPIYVPAQTISNTTRHLCCAPYVDTGFANRVVKEVIEDEQQAVPPSYGFDLDPVVRHCLRARRLLLTRHAVVTALVILGCCGAPYFTLALLGAGGAVLVNRQRHIPAWRRRLIVAALGFGVIPVAVAGIIVEVFASLLDNLGSLGDTGYSSTEWWDYTESGSLKLFRFVLMALPWLPPTLTVAMFLALFLFRRHTYTILTSELAHGVPAAPPAVHSPRIARRLTAVAAAQRGNIMVQERYPFLGSGFVAHGWSLAITLRPATEPPSSGGAAGVQTTAGERIHLDAVELHQRVRTALLGLRDPALPTNARVPGIFVAPHIVADGVRGHGDPLINPTTHMPHTLASEAAIDAITRCPQGGLRRYDRAVVPASGKAVVADDGSPVMPAQDLGIEVSAYTHFAVEGGLLYAEFIGTVLPPVRRPYKLVDALREERVVTRAFRDTMRGFLTDVVSSPWWMAQTARRNFALNRRMNMKREESREYRAYDYGARLSVRELAAESSLTKFLQTLDGWKYIKLLDRAVTEAVVEFLADKGVDTTEFRSAVTFTRNEYTTVTNISGGQQNFGGVNARFIQQKVGGVSDG